MEEQPTAAISPTPVPKQSPRPKRQQPSPDPVDSMPIGSATPKATSGGLPSPQEVRDPTMVHNTQTQLCRDIQPRL